MAEHVDLYESTYGHFNERVLAEVRAEAFGLDIGQNSWITADEYDTFYSWLEISSEAHVLEVACGSGGPALYLARKHGCRLTGVDINEQGILAAQEAAKRTALDDVQFRLADAQSKLPFEANTFDAVLCIDSINHFRDRLSVLLEWHRVLRPGRRVVFTDPVVITGPVTNAELAARSSIGLFVFVPLEVTETFLKRAGFSLVRRQDATENIQLTSERWLSARSRRRDALLNIEGDDRFEGLQRFLGAVHALASERRLSRYVFVGEKDA